MGPTWLDGASDITMFKSVIVVTDVVYSLVGSLTESGRLHHGRSTQGQARQLEKERNVSKAYWLLFMAAKFKCESSQCFWPLVEESQDVLIVDSMDRGATRSC